MKTITTLLLLLLSSSVFAETWVCSWEETWTGRSRLIGDTYTRTDDGFVFTNSLDEGANNRIFEITYESEEILNLLLNWNTEPNGPYYTYVVQIQKTVNQIYSRNFIALGNQPNTRLGNCTLVE